MTHVLLIRSGGVTHTALVDDRDAGQVEGHGWWVEHAGDLLVARARVEGRKWYMHHLLLGRGVQASHRNGNGLDNRRGNLVAPWSVGGNRRPNPDRFKGVTRRGDRWAAKIKHDGRWRWLGTFPTPDDAARAYDDAARDAWGLDAWTNFGPGPVGPRR